MAGSRINGVAVGAIGAGALLAYAGIKGYSIATTVRSVITGASPQRQPQVTPIGTPAAAPASSPVGSTSEIVAAALKYDGTHNYQFGAPPPPGKVDCSSWATDVLGHDCGLQVPGGSWAKVTNNGKIHGPNTVAYLTWSGAETVGHHSSAAQPGDLAVWQTHMGIVIGPNQMISAQDAALGTGKSIIDGAIPYEFLFIRRIILGNPDG